MDEAILKSLKDLEERRTRREVDENESFGRHIGAVLRRFSPRQQAEARLRIEQVLIDVEFPDDAHTPMHYSDNSYSNELKSRIIIVVIIIIAIYGTFPILFRANYTTLY